MPVSAAMDLHVTQVLDGTKDVHAMLPKAIFRNWGVYSFNAQVRFRAQTRKHLLTVRLTGLTHTGSNAVQLK